MEGLVGGMMELKKMEWGLGWLKWCTNDLLKFLTVRFFTSYHNAF